jgi:hypothetical protein
VTAAIFLAWAHAEPPSDSCDPVVEGAVSSARRLPVIVLYNNPEGGARHPDGSGVESGGAVVAALDALEPTLRGWGWSGDLAAMGPRSDGHYLVVWRRKGSITWDPVDAVYVRPQETLVSYLSRERGDTKQHASLPASGTEIHVFLVPPGDYGRVGIVFQNLFVHSEEP